MQAGIRFIRRGRIVTVAGLAPRTTLLDWLREHDHACGTKEGCAEGDCGACTVVLRYRRRDGSCVTEPVNSCILLLGQVHGREVITVEDLTRDGVLHPVQAAMVAHHGSQCGFCTPGIVMSLFALHEAGPRPLTRQAVTDALSGNLCRCTGYRPIIDAALDACGGPVPDRFAVAGAASGECLDTLADDDDLFAGDERQFFAAPTHEDRLAAFYLRHPDATLVAGATDAGLWVTKTLAPLQRVIWLGRVAGLDSIAADGDGLRLGATASLARAMPHLAGIDSDLGELMRRFGSAQVRASGTVGGNIANASPIGDLAPALIALGSSIELRRGEATRRMPLDAFFIGYRRSACREGEYVRALHVPKPAADVHIRCFKVSKRFDEDIAAVMAAFAITVAAGRIAATRAAYAGMAATPKRAMAAEAALVGARLDDPATWQPALTALDGDFEPLSDQRASAHYRRVVARNLLRKALIEIATDTSAATRLVGKRERRDAAE